MCVLLLGSTVACQGLGGQQQKALYLLSRNGKLHVGGYGDGHSNLLPLRLISIIIPMLLRSSILKLGQ